MTLGLLHEAPFDRHFDLILHSLGDPRRRPTGFSFLLFWQLNSHQAWANMVCRTLRCRYLKMGPLPAGIILLILLGLGLGCTTAPAETASLEPDSPWETVVQQARGTTVRMAMWDGDPMINSYMRNEIAPALEREYGVQLQVVGLPAAAVVNRLLVEREAGRQYGDIDVAWINGETFYQLRQLKALYGPFTDRLPNSQHIDWHSPFIAADFQQPIEGFECPWGNVQFALIYHSQRVQDPPRTVEAFETWVRSNPGRFTFDQAFTGMTFLKCLLSEFAGGRGSLDGPFDEEKYEAAAQRLWAYLRRLQPYLWRGGETFPENVAQLHQLFANDEIDFTMSNNDGEVDNKVLQGVLPEGSKAYVLQSGTIRNSHYLGIPYNATNKAAAMVLINHLISPEAQWKKALPAVWGDGTVLDTDRLPPPWPQRFGQLEGRTRVPPREELARDALLEPAPELMLRLHADFRREIIQRAR